MICLKSINFYDILNNAFEFTLISNRHIKSESFFVHVRYKKNKLI